MQINKLKDESNELMCKFLKFSKEQFGNENPDGKHKEN